MPPRLPYLSNILIRQEATNFLAQHHPSGTLPVPIEDIIEVRLRLEIIPVRGLKDRFDMDGFVSVDMTTITVDEQQWERYPNRYRFTLAHELGHWQLHGDFIRQLAADDVANWKQALLDVTGAEDTRLEVQASLFAGNLLVPAVSLISEFENVRQQMVRRGLDWESAVASSPEVLTEAMSKPLARTFQVSEGVITRRIHEERLLYP